MNNPKELVFNSSIAIEIVRYLPWEDGLNLASYLRSAGCLRYEGEIGALIKEKKDEEQRALIVRLAKLRLLGPKTLEDYKFLFAVEKGLIGVPPRPKLDTSRGLFNVKTWFQEKPVPLGN